jgi:5-methylcytosine-specific restriction protein A
MCLQEHRVTAAYAADHVIPHKGNAELFYYGEIQSLCKLHHDSAKQSIEQRGYHMRCDINGKPIDPNHRAHTSPGGVFFNKTK